MTAPNARHLRKPGDDRIRRAWDTVGENDLRIDREVAERLVEAVNEVLSGLYILFNQVRKHYWLVEGAESRDVGAFLRGAADRLTAATDDLAIRVHALGGVPVCGPMGMRQYAPMHIEAEHRYDVRSSLARDLDGYATVAARVRDHVELAEDFGDETTAELLREHLEALEADADALSKYLDSDTLVQ